MGALELSDRNLVNAYLDRGKIDKEAWRVTYSNPEQKRKDHVLAWTPTQLAALFVVTSNITDRITYNLQCWQGSGILSGLLADWLKYNLDSDGTIRDLIDVMPQIPITLGDLRRWREWTAVDRMVYVVSPNLHYEITDCRERPPVCCQ